MKFTIKAYIYLISLYTNIPNTHDSIFRINQFNITHKTWLPLNTRALLLLNLKKTLYYFTFVKLNYYIQQIDSFELKLNWNYITLNFNKNKF